MARRRGILTFSHAMQSCFSLNLWLIVSHWKCLHRAMSGIMSLGFRKISADKVSTSFRVREKKDKENSGGKKKKKSIKDGRQIWGIYAKGYKLIKGV